MNRTLAPRLRLPSGAQGNHCGTTVDQDRQRAMADVIGSWVGYRDAHGHLAKAERGGNISPGPQTDGRICTASGMTDGNPRERKLAMIPALAFLVFREEAVAGAQRRCRCRHVFIVNWSKFAGVRRSVVAGLGESASRKSCPNDSARQNCYGDAGNCAGQSLRACVGGACLNLIDHQIVMLTMRTVGANSPASGIVTLPDRILARQGEPMSH